MKVDNSNATSSSVAQLATQKAVTGAERDGRDSRTGVERLRDHVEVSDFASRVSQSLGTHAAQREERITALAAAYEAGTYTVDPLQVSRNIVDASLDARELD